MKKFNYDDLKRYVDDSKGFIAVTLTVEGCSKCTDLVAYTESKLIPKYNTIEFVELVIDEIPLFAPPMVPSMVFFKDGLRDHEGHGFPEPPEVIDSVIEWWLDNNKKQQG